MAMASIASYGKPCATNNPQYTCKSRLYSVPDKSCKATSLRSVEACGPLQTSRMLQCMSSESCESGHSSESGELSKSRESGESIESMQ